MCNIFLNGYLGNLLCYGSYNEIDKTPRIDLGSNPQRATLDKQGREIEKILAPDTLNSGRNAKLS